MFIGQTSGMDDARRLGRINIRTRIATTVIVLIGLALSLVGVTLWSVERATTDSKLEADLWRAVEEFDTLANEGVDPETGRRFDNPDRLLEIALQRTALSENEGELGIVEGRPRWTSPAGAGMRPETDVELLAHLLPLTELSTTSHGKYSTSIADYRYVVAPVVFEATGERGALIRVIDLNAEMHSVTQLMQIYLLVAFGSMVLVAAFTWVIAGRMLRPIESLREAADAIDEDDLTTRVPVTGSDDLTALTITINGMLDRIGEAVDAQRRLLDDVGHELRTPLTIVRGHLELMDVSDPEDVSATQLLTLDELDRMGGLVTDLLTLAKSDRPDFVQPAWTELAPLTDSTLDKARALGQHRWVLAELADNSAWLDEMRITQAWLQLADNAAKYSEPGSLIEIGSRIVGDEVRLWTRDEGIGIESDDLDLIQNRFGRSQAGRLNADGVGLGLSIVGSIVRAHSGRLEIESTPGVGSVFTMVLPLDPENEESHEHDLDH